MHFLENVRREWHDILHAEDVVEAAPTGDAQATSE